MSDHFKKPSGPSGEPEDKGQQFRVQTILIALRCWWKIAMPLGILLAVGAAAALFFTSKPQYTAEAWLTIPDKLPHLLENQWTEDPRKMVQNQLELIRSPRVLNPVASDPKVANTPEIARELHPAYALRKLLKVTARGGSDLFVISFTSEDPERAAYIVNKVAKAYLGLQQSKLTEKQALTIKLLVNQQGIQQREVKRLRDNYAELWKQHTGGEAFPIGPNASVVQVRDQASALQSKLIETRMEKLLLKAKLDADMELHGDELPEPPQGLVKESVEADEQVLLLQSQIADDKAKLRQHEEASANLENNVGYQTLKVALASRETQLEKLLSDLTEETKKKMHATATARRDDERKTLQLHLDNASISEKFLEGQLAAEMAGKQVQNGVTAELQFAQNDYQSAEALSNAITAKILSLRTEQHAPNPVVMEYEAEAPPAPDGEPPYKKMAVVAMAALCFPFGLAVLVEHMYRRVSSRDQLETSNGIPVVGEVTSLPRRSRSTKKGKRPVNRELQLFEESIDGLRTYLTLVQSLQGMQVLAITSAVSREGKTSLASQLAISIASATGESTLLIDGDMRSPDIHRAFDIERGPGLVDVLRGEVTAEDAINTEYSDSLHLLPAGSLSSSPHKLLGTEEFQTVLDRLKGRYRHILIDTPPLLPASEALLLARSADAAIVCVRRDYSRLDQTVEAFGRLRAAGVKVAGAVLNGIPARMYVYRYGAYYSERPRLTGAPAEDLAG